MRGLRWLLLLAISIVLVAIGSSYYVKKVRQAREAPPPPPELPANTTATSDTWVHTVYDGDQPVVEILAKKMRQIREPSEFELEDVELRIFQADQAGGYDRVRSALATFDIGNGDLYSEGEVEIVLDVPEDGSIPQELLLVIRSSGVHFDTKTGKATTDKPTSFEFAKGSGQSIGATYEPAWSEIRMHSAAKLLWHGAAGRDPMHVEAGEMVYKWDLNKVDLISWSKFRRGPLTLEAGDSIVFLEDEAISRVEARNAVGGTVQGDRQIDYRADRLEMLFMDTGATEKILGSGHAQLLSVNSSGETEVRGDSITLEFLPDGGESVLDHAVALGNGRLELRSQAVAGGAPPPTRVLTSETIKAQLRPGGESLRSIETLAPAVVEFLPNAPGERRRQLDGERVSMDFNERNQLEIFRASTVKTRADPLPGADVQAGSPLLTWSDELVAELEPVSGEMKQLRQWGNFRYQEGEQEASATSGTFDLANNVILLAGRARVSNGAGSTAAQEIIIDQTRGLFTANGNVSSAQVLEPERSGGGMLAAGEPVHATAESMSSKSGGSFITYSGEAVLWQGASRLRANKVDIDRAAGTLAAAGRVVSRFREQRMQPAASGAPQVEEETVVRSEELFYRGGERVAHYRGNVHLSKPGLEVDSRELRAFFLESEAGSPNGGGTNLDYALADGDVKIVQRSVERIRTGFADHAAYHLDEEKIVLSGGQPRMVDSLRGTTQGAQLTYFARDDRLLVDGAGTRPAVSKIRKN